MRSINTFVGSNGANPMTPGIFITFEGIDGAGKSSHIAALAEAFQAQGRQVVMTREPGGTPLAERLREMILHEPMDPLTEALLVFAARREHLVHVIEPALARGDVVLCDRFTDATFAYQGAGRGFDLKTLSFLELVAQYSTGLEAQKPSSLGIRQPELTVWFDVPPAVAALRLAAARTPDKFESQSQAFFERVAAGYAARAAEQPQRFARINGHQSMDAVRADVMAAVRAKGLLA
jgi:dTMP kinase